MSKFISIECDTSEVRLAVGTIGLTGVSIEKVMSAPIELDQASQPWGSPQAASALKELLQQGGIKGGNVIACVSRNDIELRSITLPLVDDNELPDMVRFAAPRYFANVNESWPLDFITMPSHLEGSIDCIVGAIKPQERVSDTSFCGGDLG
jgi:Tfp pilus assembly PilM family ATPase